MTGDRPGQGGRERRDVSIHARRVTGDLRYCPASQLCTVSIHARRVTGDQRNKVVAWVYCVSIHARRVTGDFPRIVKVTVETFQFTPVV